MKTNKQKTSERTIINYVNFPVAIPYKTNIQKKNNQVNNIRTPPLILFAGFQFSWHLQESSDLNADKSLLVELC